MTERARWGMLLLALMLGWIVILLWMPATVQASTVDLWMYQTNHSSKPLCAVFPDGRVCVTDGYTDPTTYVSLRTPGGSEVVYLRNGMLFDVYDGSTASLRCFGSGPNVCNGVGAPFNVSRFVDLPMHPQPIVHNRVNNFTEYGEQAIRLITKATFYVNTVDPESCVVLGSQGTITHSLFGYVVPSYDFSGVIGTRANVVVLEAVSGYVHPGDWPRNGMRLERYFMDAVYGTVYAEAFADGTCRAGGACNGAYVAIPGGNGYPAAPFSVDAGKYVKLPLAAPCGVSR